MKFDIYAIRDVHTGFMSPSVDANDNSAIRNFSHAVMQTQSLMHSHPEDYSLYKIGEFDTDSGEIIGTLPVHLCNAKDVI